MVSMLPIRILSLAGIVFLFIFLITWLLQYLWNTTMPEVFSLKPLSYWQAFRLILIASILFGGPRFFK